MRDINRAKDRSDVFRYIFMASIIPHFAMLVHDETAPPGAPRLIVVLRVAGYASSPSFSKGGYMERRFLTRTPSDKS
jgi:hypothetical protein